MNKGSHAAKGAHRGGAEMKRQSLKHISALTNPVRVEMLFCLCGGDMNVSQLMSALDIGQTRASHGLRTLLVAGFITVKRDGNHRIYSLDRVFSAPYLMAIDGDRWKNGG